MKTLKCDMCEATAEGESFEEWMEALKPHYKDAHPEVMADPSKTKEDMDRWMAENRERFEAAEEN
jgi:predicted small metal-binding protein